MHLFLSYCKSHIYELHALVAATIVFLFMFPLKKNIKKQIDLWVDRKAVKSSKWSKNKFLFRKRCNMSILLIALILAYAVFGLISVFSPMISFSWKTAGLSGVFALTEYAVFDQLTGGRKDE